MGNLCHWGTCQWWLIKLSNLPYTTGSSHYRYTLQALQWIWWFVFCVSSTTLKISPPLTSSLGKKQTGRQRSSKLENPATVRVSLVVSRLWLLVISRFEVTQPRSANLQRSATLQDFLSQFTHTSMIYMIRVYWHDSHNHLTLSNPHCFH